MTDQSHPGGSTARSVAATKGFFPDQNPNPVLRLESDGRLSCANAAAAPIVSQRGGWRSGSSSIPSPSKAFERPPERRHRIASRSSTSAHAGIADGLDLLGEVGRLGRGRCIPLQFRAGMHVGPAVAGVIGLKKFIYDVWGDTVNTASRMESTGVAGRLQVTPATHERLEHAFAFERRGPVEVKGKGIIETWFVTGRL